MTSQNTSSIISQVYKSRITILELMEKQGYNITDYEGFSINEVNTMKTNNQLDMILEKSTNPDDEKMDGEKMDGGSRKIYIKYISNIIWQRL